MAGRWTSLGAALGLAGTGGCAVVSPLIDRDMSKAPNSACAGLGSARAERDCFVLVEEDASGARRAWQAGPLTSGRTLVAVHRPGAGCTGTFTHLTVSGSTDGAGRATLSVWDALGRAGHARTASWGSAAGERTLTLASISSATLNPAGARVQVTEGSFAPTALCFRSY